MKDRNFKTIEMSRWRSAASLFLVPSFHFMLCFAASRSRLIGIIVLAYFMGSIVFMYLFSNAHEVFHGALGERFGGHKFKGIFLRFATVTDISSGLYLYYKYGHGPHHFDQGAHRVVSLDQKFISPSLDLDPVTNFKNIYKFKLAMDAEPRFRFPAIEYNRFYRFLAILVMPFIDTVRELWVEPIKLFNWFKLKNSPFSRRAIENALLQGLLIVSVMVGMRFLFGNWNHILYIFLCRVFFLGFLHPYAFLWTSIHNSVDGDEGYQPAVSIYGKFATFFCAGINLHVEHHDAPWVPRSALSKVREIRPELYSPLKEFSGLRASARHVFQKHYDSVYSPS